MSDTSKIDDGGAAFPEAIAIGPAGYVYHGMPGLSRRDYFAAAFMAAMLGRADATADNKEGLSVLFASVAAMSLAAADAMIAASKTGGPEHG